MAQREYRSCPNRFRRRTPTDFPLRTRQFARCKIHSCNRYPSCTRRRCRRCHTPARSAGNRPTRRTRHTCCLSFGTLACCHYNRYSPCRQRTYCSVRTQACHRCNRHSPCTRRRCRRCSCMPASRQIRCNRYLWCKLRTSPPAQRIPPPQPCSRWRPTLHSSHTRCKHAPRKTAAPSSCSPKIRRKPPSRTHDRRNPFHWDTLQCSASRPPRSPFPTSSTHQD